MDGDPEDFYRYQSGYEGIYGFEPCSVRKHIKLTYAKELIGWLLRQETSQQHERVLVQLAPLNDEALCKEVGEYFYQRILGASMNDRNRLTYDLKQCGWKDCRGLGVDAVKSNPSISAGNLYGWLTILPGEKDAVMEEMRTICSMVRSGELKAKQLKLEELENYMDRWYHT